ncbi:UNVERIFIED_CONTAM: hypothetical protein FKN15_008819 [Acipenser sinensis]
MHEVDGLAAVLKQDFPWVIPVPCMAHRLELQPDAIVVHHENVMNQKRGSIDIQGKARHAFKFLKDFSKMRFLFFMLNVLECLSRFSLKLQEDSLMLDEAVYAMDTTLMTLQTMNSHNGPKLQEFLQEVIGNQFKGVELRVSQEDDQPFLNLRSLLPPRWFSLPTSTFRTSSASKKADLRKQ